MIKPSDTAVLLASSYITSCADYVVVILRFWVENGERSKHVLFTSCDAAFTELRPAGGVDNTVILVLCSPVDEDHSMETVDIKRIEMKTPHGSSRGVDIHRPVRSLGTLETGEDYSIYLFLLYWDSFEFSTGKAVSGEEFYIHCFNLHFQARSSSSSVQVLSIGPPGASDSNMIDLIAGDIITGVT